MKTFETEKHNIPEGATHYVNESEKNYFSWGKYEGDDLLMRLTSDGGWTEVVNPLFTYALKPIPQTKEVEWVNGEIVCKVDQIMPIGIFVGLDRTGRAVVELNPVMQHANNGDSFMVLGLHNIKKPKPETEVERVEREREESAKDLHITDMSRWGFSQDLEALDEINKSAFLAIVDKTNYRKESE